MVSKKHDKKLNYQTFIIRKDIVWLIMLCVFGLAVCFLLSYDLFYQSIWGWLMTDSNSHNPFRGPAILFTLLGIPFFTIALLYHLFTFRFKYLKISKKGIDDKMSIFDKEFIPFNKVKKFAVNLNPNHIVVRYENKTKTFTELNLKEEEAKKLNAMYFSLIHKNNPPKVTNFLYHETRK